ncbi:MAG: glycosyl transferase [Frankiales bacterium]|nr:glycosyl transferase [Frankiales bacterium]
MKVAWLNHCARLGGAEIAMLRSCPTLPVEGLAVLAEDGPLRLRLESAGVRVLVLPLPERTRGIERSRALRGVVLAVLDLSRYVLLLRRLLKEEGIDVVHANTLKSGIYGCAAARLAGVPSVFHLRDSLDVRYLSPAVVRVLRVLLRLLPTVVVGNSRWTLGLAGKVRRGLVAYSPIDTAAAKPLTPHEGIRVVMLGRVSPVKGQEEFLRAFAAAFAGRTDVTAEIVGSALFHEADYEAGLPTLVEHLGISRQVVLAPFVDDIWPTLASADVLCAASVMPEPFGQVVVQGMATGLAVVAGSVGGPTEVITNGKDGLLVDPTDVAGFADAMRTLVEDEPLRHRLGAAARVRSADFGVTQANGALMTAYELALSVS